MTKLFQLDKSDDDFIVRIHDEEIVFTPEELIKALKLMKAMVFEHQEFYTDPFPIGPYTVIKETKTESVPPSVPLD